MGVRPVAAYKPSALRHSVAVVHTRSVVAVCFCFWYSLVLQVFTSEQTLFVVLVFGLDSNSVSALHDVNEVHCRSKVLVGSRDSNCHSKLQTLTALHITEVRLS